MALSADRKTRYKNTRQTSLDVAASTTLYNGGMVCVGTDGYAVSAADTAGYRVMGIAQHAVDNSSGSDGDLKVKVWRGVFELANSSSNALDQADIGRICYVEDDETVASEAGGHQVIAGILMSIDPVTSECWVLIDGSGTETEGDDVSAIETVTSGAISLFTRTSLISVTGTAAYTLADGRSEGQRKTLVVSAAASTPAGTVTPATYADGTNEHLSEVGEYLELEYHDTGGWRLVDYNIATRGAETVTTGALSLFTETSKLSVTGTIAFTLADGRFVGQKKNVIVSATASTPAGTLTPTNYSDGTSEHLSEVGEMLTLEWDGTNWHKVDFRLGKRGAETVTTGACSLYTEVSKLSVTGTQAFTLADGVFIGQEKLVIVSAVASTPAGTLAPTNYSDGTSEHFSAVGEFLHLKWDGTNWHKVAFRLSQRGTETVTSGALSLYTRSANISVTGTAAYTLADGLFVGQRKSYYCTVAASTPDGTLTPTNFGNGTSLDIDAVGEQCELEWDGTNWNVVSITGSTIT